MNAPILSSLKINLPTSAGALETFVLSEPRAYPEAAGGAFNRVAFSAVHVVADARADNDPWIDCSLDWDRTIAYREYLWGLGLGVAEAMDTAQRGMGLDWRTSLELIRRTVNASKAWTARAGRPALIAAGCGTDQLDAAQGNLGEAHSIDAVICAYEEQMAAIEKAIAEDAGCAAILHQVAGVRGAVSGLMDELIEDHVREHVAHPKLSAAARAEGADGPKVIRADDRREIFPFRMLGIGGRAVALAALVFNLVAATSYPDISEAGIKDHILWGALLAFYAARGGLEAARYPVLLRASFGKN